MLKGQFFFAEVVDNFDWGAYLREGEETYSTIYADSDVSNRQPTSLSFLPKLQLKTYMYIYAFKYWGKNFESVYELV